MFVVSRNPALLRSLATSDRFPDGAAPFSVTGRPATFPDSLPFLCRAPVRPMLSVWGPRGPIPLSTSPTMMVRSTDWSGSWVMSCTGGPILSARE